MAPFLCNFCPNIYGDEQKFRQHIRNVHEEEKFKCEECNEDFSSKRLLYNHRKKHTSQEYTCEQCEYKTKQKTNLKRHVTTKHVEAENPMKILKTQIKKKKKEIQVQ